MIKKFLFGALTLLLALTLVGCGAKKNADADKKDQAAQKTEVVTPEGSADKAVLAYAQLCAYGMPDDDALKAAGLTEKDVAAAKEKVFEPLLKSFGKYPLNDESINTIKKEYAEKLQTAMEIKAAVKTDDKEKPVVELTATTINKAGAAKIAEENADLMALAAAFDELKAQGLTDEDLKASEDFQAFALESIDKYVNEFPLNDKASLEVTCVAKKADDGKTYWAPEDISVVEKFVTGQ